MFKIKFPTKRIFRIFPILRINGMAPFCNLFMERPSYNSKLATRVTCDSNAVVVSTADRRHAVSDVHELWTEVVKVRISITAQLTVVHLTTCIQFTSLCQTATNKRLKVNGVYNSSGHTGLHRAASHSTQVNLPCLSTSQSGWHLINLHRTNGKLSWP